MKPVEQQPGKGKEKSDATDILVNKVFRELIEFCIKENINHPLITANYEVSGKNEGDEKIKYRLLFERIEPVEIFILPGSSGCSDGGLP